MAVYVAESNYHTLEHGGHDSQGVVGSGPGSEKIYLHVIPVTDAELALLKPRVDDSGNQQHDRLALPDREDWWIAIEGEKAWPGTVSPRITSKCTLDASGRPTPVALAASELAQLERLKAKLPR